MDERKLSQLRTVAATQQQEINTEFKHAEEILEFSRRGLIPRPKGFLRRRCPHDKAKLKQTGFKQVILGIHYINWYECPVCDYEYATDDWN